MRIRDAGRKAGVLRFGSTRWNLADDLGVGSREAQVRKAYGRALAIVPHKYADAPAHYLTYWKTPGQRGVRYETNEKGVVTIVHVGAPSIE